MGPLDHDLPGQALGQSGPGAYGVWGASCPIVASAGCCDYGHVKTSSQLSDLFSVTVMGAPSRIRTCAHGSGGGKPHLSNWCISPARSRSLISLVAKLIPRIFRIMESSAVTTRSLGDGPRPVRPGCGLALGF